MNPRSLRVDGTDELSLHLLEWSDRGPPLLLLHGFGHDARVWDDFIPVLAPRYRTLALDARGHGDSDHDAEYRYHHGAGARDIEAVLDQLEIDATSLVAHSMSGYAAIRFAARCPQRVTRLVLVDAGPQLRSRARNDVGRNAEASYATIEDYAAALARSHPRVDPATLLRLAGHWLRRREDGRLIPKLDPAFARPRTSKDPAARRNFDRAQWARKESERLWDFLSGIGCPVLVIYGEQSPMLSGQTVERMLGVLRDGCAVCVPGAGHAVMLEAPDAFRAALADFLLTSP